MEIMAEFARIIKDAPNLDDSDRDWLHRLVADWQVIADLGYMDLQLVIPVADGHFIYAGQCRPSTGVSVRPDDLVGHLVDSDMRALLMRAMGSHDIFRSRQEEEDDHDDYYDDEDEERDATPRICDTFTGIWHNGRAIGVLIRETNLNTRGIAGRYELEGITAAKALFSMVSRGEFPYSVAVNKQRHNPRVSDGFTVLDSHGVINCSSPNAISCLRRLGSVNELEGRGFDDVIRGLLGDNKEAIQQMQPIYSGMEPADTTLEANGSAIAFRTLPLNGPRGHFGAVILYRDITELRRRDEQLKTKDATISEIHHRVKNNLQSVSALLRLQARRTKNDVVKRALFEAQRRVQAIAMVHESLSQSADEMVDFDAVLHELLRMTIDVEARSDQHISLVFEGKFGKMPSQDATPLSLVLNELVTNCVEHGFEGRTSGTITVSVARWKNDLNISVEDDGIGLEASQQMEHDDGESGLGTQIVNTFISSDFGGTVTRSSKPEGGTRVDLTVTLRAAQNAERI